MFKQRRTALRTVLALFAIICLAGIGVGIGNPSTAFAATPPTQPTSGPGSSDYPYPGAPFIWGVAGVGGYTIYEPNPRPASAPVIVIFHGGCVVGCGVDDLYDLNYFEGWATHLAKKGNIVIYPRFNTRWGSPPPEEHINSAVACTQAAIAALQADPGKTQPDLTRFGYVGHSGGGWMAINMAAVSVAQGLPHPDYVYASQPGYNFSNPVPQENWSQIPSDMLLVVDVGDADTEAGEGQSYYIANHVLTGTTTVPYANKDYVRVRSDSYGTPTLVADHKMFRVAGFTDGETDAIDFFHIWKTNDALRDCTGYGTNCNYLGNTTNQRYMGLWSDGTPVKTTCPTDNPSETWEVSCAAGQNTPPANPTGLVATAGDGQVSLDWADNSEPDLAGYNVYRSTTSGGPYDKVNTSLVTVSNYVNTGLANGTTYYFVVRAVDTGALESGNSNQASATPVAGPTTLFTDDFETNFDKWTDGGTTDWDRATDQKHAGSYAAHAGSADNDLISDNINTAAYTTLTIAFWYRDDDIDDSDDIYIQLYNGSTYVNRLELGNSPEDVWNYGTITLNNSGGDAVYFRSNFRIKFEGTSIDSGENLWIDDVLITAQ